MDERTHSILLALAWLGEATKTHLGDLCCPGKSQRTLERALEPLMVEGASLVQARPRHRHDGSAPKRESYAYSLTPAGHARIKADGQYPRKLHRDQYPAKLADSRTAQLLEHDLQVAEIVVRLVVLARAQGLSGAFVAREVRLDRQRADPVLDAVVVLHVGGTTGESVPWTKDSPAGGERAWCFGIEGDRGTEPDATIAAKARAYRDAFLDPRSLVDWRERYGQPLPLICWAAPTEKRLAAIDVLWKQEWPHGSWLLATPDRLVKEGTARLTRNGSTETVRLFAGSSSDYLMVRVAPPTTKPVPATPPQTQPAPHLREATSVVRPAPSPQAESVSLALTTSGAATRPVAAPGFPPSQSPPPTASVSRALPPAQPAAQTVKRTGWRLVWVVVAIVKLPWVLVRGFWHVVASVWMMFDDFAVGQGEAWLARLLVVIVGAALLLTAPRWLPTLVDAAQPATEATAQPAATLLPLPSTPLVVATVAPATCGEAQISADRVHLRRAPGTKNESLAKLARETRLTLLCAESTLADGSRWTFVRTEAGQEGWVAAQFVRKVP